MQTRKALKALSNGKVDYNTVNNTGPLAKHADRFIQAHNDKQEALKADRSRRSVASAMPILQAAREQLDAALGDKVLPTDTPIVSRFDAFSVIKDASKELSDDRGLKQFATHLERLWHKEPLGTITAGALTRLRDHYQYNYTNSRVSEIVDTVIPKVSFNTLPVTNLIRTASQINSQEDYNIVIGRLGLSGDSPNHVRARTFIRALINRRQAVEAAPKTMEEMQEQAVENEEGQFDKFKEITPPRLGSKRGSDIASRVASRIQKTAQEDVASVQTDSDIEAESDVESSIKSEDLGVDGTGVMPVNAEIIKAAQTGEGFEAAVPQETPAEFSTPGVPTSQEISFMVDSAIAYSQHPEIAKLLQQLGVDAADPNAAQSLSTLVHDNPEGVYPILEQIDNISNQLELQEMKNPSQQMIAMYQKLAQGLDEGGSFQEVDFAPTGLPVKIDPKDDVSDSSEELMADEGLTQSEYDEGEEYSDDAEQELVQNAFEEFEQNFGAAAAKEKKAPLEPKVNDQQPDQISVPNSGLDVLTKERKMTQKRPSLKAAVSANNPMVDDGLNHLPVFTPHLARMSLKFAGELKNSPAWWLGSVEELQTAVHTAIKIKAGEIPEAFKKHVKSKGKGKDKDDDDGDDCDGKFPDKMKNMKKKKSTIEEVVSSGNTFKSSGYAIGVNTSNQVVIQSKKGFKEYQLLEMDSAINDFIYLAGTAKHSAGEPPQPTFYIREGIRLTCPACYTINNYQMPKNASDMSCGKCETIIPSNTVTAALEIEAAAEESVLVATVASSLQEEFGNKFASAAEKLSADAVDVIGNRVEAHALNVSDDVKSNVWDFMVEAGFKPIALDMEDIDLPEEPMDEMPGLTDPMAGPGSGEIYASLEHYKSKDPGMKWDEAVIQYISDFKENLSEGEVNLEDVISASKSMFGGDEGMGGMPMVMASVKRIAGDLPNTNVNTQQPGAEVVPSKVLGPDSDTHGEIPTPGSIKSQSKPQGGSSDINMSHGDDGYDPGDFGAGKPKPQHPATNQQGTSLTPTDLGKHSPTQPNPTTNKWDSESSAAPSNMRSK